MKPMARFLAIGALVVSAALASTVALTQDAASPNKQQDKPADAAAQGSAESAKPKPAAAARRARKRAPADETLYTTKSLASRTALCRADCTPTSKVGKNGVGIHGFYRTYDQGDPERVKTSLAYGQWDPHVQSIEGKQQFDSCMKTCLGPTPAVGIGQRMVLGMGFKWFGKTKRDCLACHSSY